MHDPSHRRGHLSRCSGSGGVNGSGGGNGGVSLSRGPLSSGPVQITADDKTVWVVNPDTDSVTAVDARTNRRGPEYQAGDEPRNLAISPDGPVFNNVNVQSCLSVLDITTDAEGKVDDLVRPST